MYLWDLDSGFAGVILIKKAGDGSKKIKGCWDSIHVVEVQVRMTSQRNRWNVFVVVQEGVEKKTADTDTK